MGVGVGTGVGFGVLPPPDPETGVGVAPELFVGVVLGELPVVPPEFGLLDAAGALLLADGDGLNSMFTVPDPLVCGVAPPFPFVDAPAICELLLGVWVVPCVSAD